MSIEVYETMSTATMWLLLFVVAALALLIAALTKTKFTVQKISIIGIMAAHAARGRGWQGLREPGAPWLR